MRKMTGSREREIRALELRAGGATCAEIAAQLGFRDESGARKAIDRATERARIGRVAEARSLANVRLEKLLAAVWDRALKGDVVCFREARRTVTAIAELSGCFKEFPVDPQEAGHQHGPGGHDDATGAGGMAEWAEATQKCIDLERTAELYPKLAKMWNPERAGAAEPNGKAPERSL